MVSVGQQKSDTHNLCHVFFIQEVVSFFGIVIIIPEGVGYFDVYLHVLLLLSVFCFFPIFLQLQI